MKNAVRNFSRRYQSALRHHLLGRSSGAARVARSLGAGALAVGWTTLDLAKLHEQALVAKLLPTIPRRKRETLIRRASLFFTAAITPLEMGSDGAVQSARLLRRHVETLSLRTVELAAANHELGLEISRRKDVEEALTKSKRHYSTLLAHSTDMQEQLRCLSQQIMSAQEEERRSISRELHDVIAQTLTSINVRLSSLKKDATRSSEGLDLKIGHAQRLIEKSVNIVHRFARNLRPAVLDDLGLIPALHTFMKEFSGATGVLVRLTSFAGIDTLDVPERTVLFRVAQEAVNNVGRHARAKIVTVHIVRRGGWVNMDIVDDGKSFDVDRQLVVGTRRRLGLLGMRERLEMIGGTLAIESSPGKGMAIHARVPFNKCPQAIPAGRTRRIPKVSSIQ